MLKFWRYQYGEMSIEKGAVINGQLLLLNESANRHENKKFKKKKMLKNNCQKVKILCTSTFTTII